MATDSSLLAWEVPRIEEPGGLQSMGWQRLTVQQCGLVTEQQQHSCLCGKLPIFFQNKILF